MSYSQIGVKPRPFSSTLISTLLLLLLSAPFERLYASFEEEAVYRLSPVVVTATRGAEMADEMIAPVTVITREEIERSSAHTLPELLASEGSVSVTTLGGAGKVSSLFLRGTNSGHVLVLIDGVRLQSATLGTPALEHIPLSHIERIEIVRGGRSSLYGSDAIGGVIHIITRRGEGQESWGGVSLGWGNERTRSVSAQMGKTTERSTFNFRLSHEETDGYDLSTLPTTHPDNDGYRNHSLGLTWDYTLSQQTELALSALMISSESEIDSPWSVVPTPDDIETASQYLLTLSAKHRFNSDWKADISTYASIEDYISDSAGIRESHFRTERQGVDGLLRYTGLEDQEWALGLDLRRETVGGESVSTYLHRDRLSRALFAQWIAHWGEVTTQTVLRYDAPDRGESVLTGNVEAVIPLNTQVELALGIHRAFKQPTMNDLYYVDAWGSSGNPTLAPELAHGVDLRLEWQRARWTGRLGLFAQRIEQLIVWVEQPLGSWNYTPINLEEADIRGVELAWSYHFDAARFDLLGTFQRAEEHASKNPLPRRAEQEWRARLTGALPFVGSRSRPVEGVLEAVYIGERYDDAAALNRLASYTLWHTGLRYQVDSNWRLSFDVRNLFNHDTLAALNYPIQGRHWRVGVQLDF